MLRIILVSCHFRPMSINSWHFIGMNQCSSWSALIQTIEGIALDGRVLAYLMFFQCLFVWYIKLNTSTYLQFQYLSLSYHAKLKATFDEKCIFYAFDNWPHCYQRLSQKQFLGSGVEWAELTTPSLHWQRRVLVVSTAKPRITCVLPFIVGTAPTRAAAIDSSAVYSFVVMLLYSYFEILINSTCSLPLL